MIKVPNHIAIIMDGNGRWANSQGLPRTKGHEVGEAALMEVIQAALEIGIKHLTAYAFSTENWKRSPREVRFLMGFSRKVIRAQKEKLHSWGVRIKWLGIPKRLWPSVISELEAAQELTKNNTKMTLYLCVNYGGRAEIVNAAKKLAMQASRGEINPARISEKTFAQALLDPDLPDVDLLWRTGGENRISNFLLWQAAYAEIVVTSEIWPQANRAILHRVCQEYALRDRRFGGAIDKAILPEQ